MLDREAAVLILVDFQEKLLPAIHGADEILSNACSLAAGAQVLNVPVIYTEQYPKGLGSTVPELKANLSDEAVEKNAFSCCGEPAFMKALEDNDRRQVILAGIETHVCVCQTALQLLDQGFEVHVIADAVGSRSLHNRDLALRRMEAAGAEISSLEMALFELLGVAQGDDFKAILKLVK